ncbi:unnamed protein product [Caretta caretta]
MYPSPGFLCACFTIYIYKARSLEVAFPVGIRQARMTSSFQHKTLIIWQAGTCEICEKPVTHAVDTGRVLTSTWHCHGVLSTNLVLKGGQHFCKVVEYLPTHQGAPDGMVKKKRAKTTGRRGKTDERYSFKPGSPYK